MKKILTICALSLIGATQHAQAIATYQVNAAIIAYTFANAPNESDPLTITSAYVPAPPSATGLWNIDTANASVSGNLDYQPFSQFLTISDSFFGNLGTLTFTYPHSQSNVVGNTGNFDAAARTLTLTGVTLQDVGEFATCFATGFLTCPPQGPTDTRGSGSMTITLTFDPSFSAFSGVGTHTFAHENGSADVTSWSFNGTEVPIPAAGWLFISSLVGLAGSKRRKS